MKLSTALPKDLLAQAQNMNAAVAQQVLAKLETAKGSTSAKVKDLELLLRGCDTVSDDARQMLQSFIDNHGKAKAGCSVNDVRKGEGKKGCGASHELPAGQIMGSEIASCYANDDQAYRTESLPLDILRKVGTPDDMMALLDRADELGAGGNDCVSVDELVNLEKACALMPAEKRALKNIWRYMEASGKTPEVGVGDVPYMQVEDLTVRPEKRSIDEVPVEICGLPKNLQTAATRAAMIAQGCDEMPTTVTLANLQFAIENEHQQSTPKDREKFAELCAPVQASALEQVERPLSAKVKVPDLGEKVQQLVDCKAIDIKLISNTKIEGTEVERSCNWRARGTSHRRGAPCIPAPKSFPPPYDVKLAVNETHQIKVEVPEGFNLVVQHQAGKKEAQVLGSGQNVTLRPGQYSAMLMRNGRLVQEAAFEVPNNQRQDLSKYHGFAMETVSGEKVGLQRTNAKYLHSTIRGVEGADHGLGRGEHPVQLEPGRYEGRFNNKIDFALEVLPGNNLSVFHDGQCIRLNFNADRKQYVGNFKGKVFRFDPKTNSLSHNMEGIQRHHGSTSWSYSVKSNRALSLAIDDKMRVA